MKPVMQVDSAEVYLLKFPSPIESLMAVNASGQVRTTGWTHIRLSPRYYVVPPSDGLWDFDMIGDEPSGVVGEVVLPVTAHIVAPALPWCRGVRIHSETNSVEAKFKSTSVGLAASATPRALAPGQIIVQQHLVSYDDSIQPTGRTKWDPWPHAEMKKLHHDLVLIVEGPDEAKIRDCIRQAIAAGLLAAIVAALATLGAALPAAISAFVARLESCLGNSFRVRVENQSHWVYWWT